MEQCSRNGVLIQAVSTIESNREWSGSGFIINEIPNGFMILTSASWMIDILYISDGVKGMYKYHQQCYIINYCTEFIYFTKEIKNLEPLRRPVVASGLPEGL